MIELVFGDSAAGALKYAKSMKRGMAFERLTAAAAINGPNQGRQKFQEHSPWQGRDIAGGSEDVASLSLYLDIGDIKEGLAGRKAVLDMLFDGFFGYAGVSDEMWRISQSTLSRLKDAMNAGDKIRIWLCVCDPAEMCGLYFVCNMLEGSNAQVSIIRIPRSVEKNGTVTNYRSTGEVGAERFGDFMGLEAPLSAALRSVYASEWKNFVKENAPLRVYLNGELVSVPEDFYDFAIRANIPDGEFVCAKLIGKTLIATPGVGDRWLHLRIKEMIKSGELTEVSPTTGDHPYMGVLKHG